MSAPVAAPVTVADARHGLTHLVTDQAMSAGRVLGRYVAVCGVPVLAASLTAPDQELCRRCAAWWAQRCR